MSRANTQFTNGGRNLQCDYGTVILGADGTATVYTQLSQLRAALVSHRSAISPSPPLASARVSGTAPYITLTDPAGAVNASAVVNYFFVGR